MEDTGRSKMRQKNWSFRGFRTKYLGLECPSGIFPRYSLRQCKCWLNGMVTSKNGIIHRRYCICPIFCNVLLIMSFLLIMNIFLANTCIFFISKFFNTMLHFFCTSWHCLLFMERFGCNVHANSAYLQYMEDTGRSKMRQEFWSFRGFRTKYINKVRMPVGIFPRQFNVD